MTEFYFSEEECFERVHQLLWNPAPGKQDPMLDAVSYALVNEMEQGESAANDPHALEIKVGAWAIRGDELDLLSVIKDSVLAYLSSKTGGNVPSAVVGLAVSIAKLLLAVYRKGVRLSPNQSLVFTELRRGREPRTVESLAGELGGEWNAARVEVQLESLSAAQAIAGSVKLAERMPDGRWIANA